MPITLDGTNGITTPMYNGSITANAVTPSVNMKNRIINGAMVIDQRNAGASVTPADGNYTLDRWRIAVAQSSKLTVQQDAGAVTAPVGFNDYLGVTSSSAYSITSSDYFLIQQYIEGFNCADLNWGTANAKTITLSFWVRSSLTGTFGGSLANNGNNRSYPFTYTISSANTWEQKSITVVGDTSGTWLVTNGIGIRLTFGLGVGSTFSGTSGSWSGSTFLSATGATSVVGTNGATFYITGVQLEVGSTATSFDYRPYTTELALCQRYYYLHVSGTNQFIGTGWMYDANNFACAIHFPVTMRTAPTISATSGTNYYSFDRNGGTDSFNSLTISRPQLNATAMFNNSEVSGTAGNAGMTFTNNASAFISLQAEL